MSFDNRFSNRVALICFIAAVIWTIFSWYLIIKQAGEVEAKQQRLHEQAKVQLLKAGIEESTIRFDNRRNEWYGIDSSGHVLSITCIETTCSSIRSK